MRKGGRGEMKREREVGAHLSTCESVNGGMREGGGGKEGGR
jgi:hypothetical protein